MPEGPEIRIMSDFINQKSFDKKFISAFHVKKGNQPFEFDEDLDKFEIVSTYHGKKLILHLKSTNNTIPIYVFMGMSGSWKWVETKEWSETKYTRLKFDTIDGKSLLLYGGYLGPKYSMYQNFKSSKSGPDIIQEYDYFVENVKSNLNKEEFKKPIYEVLLNQIYFAGVGNYLRSTIIYYADIDPFSSAFEVISDNHKFYELCRETLQKSYELNGGQLKDWSNPFNNSSDEFDKWVFYQKGSSLKDKQGRTFWYDTKWEK